jgi:hypothetical protein
MLLRDLKSAFAFTLVVETLSTATECLRYLAERLG